MEPRQRQWRWSAIAVGCEFALLIAMLTWHYLLGPPFERGTFPLLMAMGLSMALVSLVAISGAVLSLHWPKRVAAVVTGTAVIGGLLICVFDWPTFYLWQLLFELATTMVFQIAVLGALSLIRRPLLPIRASVDQRDEVSGRPQKLSIRDLFLLVTAFALLFAVMRFLQPARTPVWLYKLLIAAGCAAGTIGLTTAWAALSRRGWLAPIIVIIANALGAAALYALLQQSNSWLLFDPWWYAGGAAIETVAILLPLALLRPFLKFQ
jgi:uncharacterized membrane protein YbjE (DUF340 family)